MVWNTTWLEPFRALFSDERADYAAALKVNYENGPPPDWADRHISAYASTHRREDWAETRAHSCTSSTASTRLSYTVWTLSISTWKLSISPGTIYMTRTTPTLIACCFFLIHG